MRAARVLAQAKINLSLKVLEREPSGYHQIDTLFQRIDLADEVVVRMTDGERALDMSGPRVPDHGLGPVEKNLAYRAAMEYSARTGWTWPRGFAIELTKNIPVGGGLGGGSADAGAVLRALDALAPARMDADQFHDLARSLGSDVPFLASENVNAHAVGRGEILSPWPPPPPFGPPPAEVLIVVPPFAISTSEAYRWLDEGGPRPSPFGEASVGHGELQPVPSLWAALGLFDGNDFESVVEERYPKLREYRERLAAAGASIARLSGSGSCVFGLFENDAPSEEQLGIDAPVITTRTSERVVQVEVLE